MNLGNFISRLWYGPFRSEVRFTPTATFPIDPRWPSGHVLTEAEQANIGRSNVAQYIQPGFQVVNEINPSEDVQTTAGPVVYGPIGVQGPDRPQMVLRQGPPTVWPAGPIGTNWPAGTLWTDTTTGTPWHYTGREWVQLGFPLVAADQQKMDEETQKIMQKEETQLEKEMKGRKLRTD